MTTSFKWGEGGAGGAGRPHPGPPGPTLLRTCPGPRWVPTPAQAAGTHTLPALRLSPAPTFAILGGPGTPGSAQHPLHPIGGSSAPRAQPSNHLCPLGGAWRSGSAQHPPCSSGASQWRWAPYPSRLSPAPPSPSLGDLELGLSPAPTFALGGGHSDPAQHPPWPPSSRGPRQRHQAPVSLQAQPSTHLQPSGTRTRAQPSTHLALLGARQWHRAPVSPPGSAQHPPLALSSGPLGSGGGPPYPPGSAGPFFCLLTFHVSCARFLRD